MYKMYKAVRNQIRQNPETCSSFVQGHKRVLWHCVGTARILGNAPILPQRKGPVWRHTIEDAGGESAIPVEMGQK